MKTNYGIWFVVLFIIIMGFACGEEGDSGTDGDLAESDATDGDGLAEDGDSETDGDSPDGDYLTDGDVPDGDMPDGDIPDGDDDGDDEDDEIPFPEPICKTPPDLRRPYFTDVTAEMGIDPEGLALVGNRIVSADLNGDDYPDLVVHVVTSNKRDDYSADPPKIYKRLLLNQPDPQDASKRIFVDITQDSGYAEPREGEGGRSCQFAIFGDVNNDGALDTFSATYVDSGHPETDPGDRSEILIGDGAGNFSLADPSDTTPSADQLWTTTSAAFTDFDRDGNLDLWVGFFYEEYGYLPGLQNRLYKGDGQGNFSDVTDSGGLATTYDGFDEGDNHKPTYGATVCDVNDDGWPDLLTSTYGRQYNELWLNENGSFREIGRSSGFASDENLDYSDNEMYKCHCEYFECDPPASGSPRIQCTPPPGTNWSSTDEKPWRLGGNTFTTICGDWTGDGLPDLFNAEIAHWHIGQSSDPSQLLVNESTADEVIFTRPGREATGLTRNHSRIDWNEGDITAVRFDFDLDGYPDLYLGNSDYPGTWGLLFRQISDGVFKDVTSVSAARHERANGLTYADFDRDGDLDLVVGSSLARQSPWETAEVHIYQNNFGQDSNAIRLTLIGKGEGGANVSAVGARVKVRTGDRTQTEWVQAGFGHFGMQSELPLTIGLGAACMIDELEIRWPNADLDVQTFTDVPANYHIVLHEGQQPSFEALSLKQEDR